jgi:tetratricopeptide (TPR) repeat protein
MAPVSAVLVVALLLAGDGPAAPPPAKEPVSHGGPLAKVLEEAKAKGRIAMVHFGADDSPILLAYEAENLRCPEVAAAAEGRFVYYRVVLGRGEAVDIGAKHDVRTPGAVLFLDASGEVLDRVDQMWPKARFVRHLGAVAAGDHLRGLRALAAKSPEDARVRARLGIRLFDGGMRDEAQEHLEKAVALDPEDQIPDTVEARWCLARRRAYEERDSAPYGEFAKKYPESPWAVDAVRALFRSALSKGDEERVREHGEFLLRRAPDADVRNGLAWFLATNGKELDRALALVDEALKEQPRNAAFLDTRAECLSRLGRHDEAVAAQKEAIANIGAGPLGVSRAELERRLAEFEKRRDEAKAKTR